MTGGGRVQIRGGADSLQAADSALFAVSSSAGGTVDAPYPTIEQHDFLLGTDPGARGDVDDGSAGVAVSELTASGLESAAADALHITLANLDGATQGTFVLLARCARPPDDRPLFSCRASCWCSASLHGCEALLCASLTAPLPASPVVQT